MLFAILVTTIATLYIGGLLAADARLFEARAANDAYLAELEALPSYDVIDLEIEHIELTGTANIPY